MDAFKRSFFLIVFALLFFCSVAKAQPVIPGGNPVWTSLEQVPLRRGGPDAWVQPPVSRAFSLNHAALRQVLDRGMPEELQPLVASESEITLPMPDGTMARFRFVESSVMAPELAAKFPEIKTYVGQGIDDPMASVRFDLTPAGFHAQILSPRGAVYIDPQFRGDPNIYAIYYKRDYRRAAAEFECLTEGQSPALAQIDGTTAQRSGTQLRKYRLACAATGEYTQFHGGTVNAGMAAIVTAVNRVTGVYELEIGVRFELVANNDLIVYTNSATDPYTNNNGGTMLGQNQANLDSVIGSANYDIGHVFSTGGGGIAGLGVVCVTGQKARGVTGLGSPIGDAFYIDYVAHEVGHQFGANHTFNSATGSCGGGNRNASTAYEPGSGSTIMAYAGICGADNLQSNSDPYFHSASFDEMLTFTTLGSGNSCPVITSTGNTVPTVNAGPNYTIPASTPFVLTATGSDANGDVLTYCWEERDLGAAQTLTAGDNGSSPLFRSYNPTTNAFRYFPQLNGIRFNTNTPGEKLPTTSRTMNFRVTARDNRAGGGGVNTANMQVTVVGTAGPFVVTSPNTSVTWSNVQTVTWNVAGTASAPVNASNVDILLSTNGGLTFPIVLAAGTPNDGSESVLLPNITTSQARIRVQGSGNIFFDMSDANFSIIPSIPAPHVVIDSAVVVAESCSPGNGVMDPGEVVTLRVALRNAGNLNTTNIVATLLATNGVTFPSGAQTYGLLVAGGPAVTNFYTFTADGICGGTVKPTFQIQDGAANTGNIDRTFALGVSVASSRSFTNASGITIPASGTQGKAIPYPSSINVTGLPGNVVKATVTLRNLSHTFLSDIDILLVGPGGQKLLLMSDVGESTSPQAVSNRTYTFDDDAASFMLAGALPFNGTYKPTNIGAAADTFASPAPGAPYGSALSIFNGVPAEGVWSLYVHDDANQDTGNIALGWVLNLTVDGAVCCSSPAVADLAIGQTVSPTLVSPGGLVQFTLNITNHGPNVADGVLVTNTLPSGLAFVSAVPSQGIAAHNAGVVSAELGTLASGAAASIVIQATATAPGNHTNTATVASAVADLEPGNNAASAAVSVNHPPVIFGLNAMEIAEDTSTGAMGFTVNDNETAPGLLTVTAQSSDTNLVALEGIVFGGGGTSRTVTVTPLPDQFGQCLISVIVSDGMDTATNSFVLTVTPVNDPPVLGSVANRTVHAGSTIVVPLSASDPDLPPDDLVFSLGTVHPSGAAVDPTSGVFTWTADASLANTTNVIEVKVTDSGVPPLSDTKSFLVMVEPPPLIQTVLVSNDIVTIRWSAISGQVYRLQHVDNFHEAVWSNLPPDVTATGTSAEKDDVLTPAERFYRIYVVP